MPLVADLRLAPRVDPGSDRWWVDPPGRLREVVGRGNLLVELHDGPLDAVLGRLVTWAEAAAAATGALAVPIEAGAAADGMTWVARTVPGGRRAAPPDVRAVAVAARGIAALHAAGGVHGALRPNRLVGTAVDLPPWRATPWPLLHAGRAIDIDTVAPEVLRGEQPGPAADVWSLGALLVVAAARHPARPALADADLLAGMAIAAAGSVVLDGLPGPIAEVARCCTAQDPDERPGAAQMAEALEEALR